MDSGSLCLADFIEVESFDLAAASQGMMIVTKGASEPFESGSQVGAKWEPSGSRDDISCS